MELHTKMRLLVVWCLAIHVVDCWTTFKLANYYGWEGEVNLLVKGFISQSVYHLILLKLVTISPLMYLWSVLWEDSDFLDMRHEWGIVIMFAYNCFATGMILGNIMELIAVIKLQEGWTYG